MSSRISLRIIVPQSGMLVNNNCRSSTNKTYVKKNIHIFSGILSCGNCGASMYASPSKMRQSGWIPSVYGCGARRKNPSACDNKFVGDSVLAPFILTLLSNIIKSKNNSSDRTSLETFEKKLLKGDALKDVRSIDPAGLQKFLEHMVRTKTQKFFYTDNIQHVQSNEQNILEEKRKRCETGLARLHSLYLYGEEAISEKDFIVQKVKIQQELEKVNKRLSELKEVSDKDRMESLNEQASYLIMVRSLTDERIVD